MLKLLNYLEADMQRFCFFFITFGLFISSNALAMHAESSAKDSENKELQVSKNEEPLDLTVTTPQAFVVQRSSFTSRRTFSTSCTVDKPERIPSLEVGFGKQNSEPLSLSLKQFSSAQPGTSSYAFAGQRSNFTSRLERCTSFASGAIGDSEKFLSLGDPRRYPSLDDVLFPVAPLPKPVVREGIALPKVDLAHLGISDFFGKFGVSLGEYDFLKFLKKPERTFDIVSLRLELFKPLSFVSFLFEPESLSQIPLPELTDAQIIRLFKHLTSFSSSVESMTQLEDLLQDPRVRHVVLETSKGSEDLISAAFKAGTSILSDPRKLKILIAAEGFLEHILSQPADEEGETVIIRLFKHLTSCSSTESMTQLEELLQDPRVRTVLLETSRGSKDPISSALEIVTGFRGNPRKLKTLIAAEGFLEHILSQPADEKGKTVLSKAFLDNIFLNCLEELTIFFENPRICEHLYSIPDEKYQSVVMRGLISAVALPNRELLPAFYESRVIFDHLVACFSRGDLVAQLISKVYTRAGLMMALSERAEEKINNLLHEGVVNIIREDADLIIQVMKKAIKDRNPYLARKLLADLELSIPPIHIKEAIEIQAIWEALSNESKQILLATMQAVYPHLTEEGLIRHHKQIRAYEHASVGHPLVVDDMEAFEFKELTKYQELLAASSNPLDREAQKKALEREFLRKFPTAKTAPWFHAEAEAAYDLRMFGQGVHGLVVELDVLPEHQREGLLHSHLGEETVYKGNATGVRTAHNIGVTSLVAQMAPLAAITSTSTSHLKELETHLTEGKYPFINCSWGPCSELSHTTDSPFSIFSSHKELNALLGRSDIVLIKSAGNEGASLSSPESTEEIAAKVFSKLLCRLKPEETTNLILAINLDPANRVSASSNTPGTSERIYRHTISAQGSETLWLDETGHQHRPLQDGGTSSAAPIVTGAALLLKSYKEALSPLHIKACLLHSARREFSVYSEEGVARLGVYETVPSETWKQEELPQEQYSFSKYGMGILNVKAAFEYANVLETYLTSRSVDQPVTFEEFESLRERLPVRPSRSSHGPDVEFEGEKPF